MDRNCCPVSCVVLLSRSLSARRAWIEIAVQELIPLADPASLSARRAWIEMPDKTRRRELSQWSLSARRAWIEIKSGLQPLIASVGRSPQGERG